MFFQSCSVLFLAFLICVACSGGGGGSDTPPLAPTPPPPALPANVAPELVIASVSSTVDERQSLTIDASASSDADGDSLSFEISVSGSSNVRLVDTDSAPVWTIETNEVSEDETFSVTVTVSAGEHAISETLDFTLSNYDRAPLSAMWGTETTRLAFDDSQNIDFRALKHVPVSHEAYSLVTDGTTSAIEIIRSDGDAAYADPILSLPNFAPAQDKLFSAELNFLVDTDFVLLSPETGRVQIFLSDPNDHDKLLNAGTFVVPGACTVVEAYVGDYDDTLTGGNFAFGSLWPGLLIGTDTSLTALINNAQIDQPQGTAGSPRPALDRIGTFSESRLISMNGNFCHLQRNPAPTRENPAQHEIFDPVRSEIVQILSTRGDEAIFGKSIPISSPEGMELIDIKSGANMDLSTLRFLLFSSGEHDKGHQLTIIHEDKNGSIEQRDVPLPNGVPTQLYTNSIDLWPDENQPPTVSQDYDSDIIITAPETPYIYVLENLSSPTEPFCFGEITYFEVGYGVNEVEQIIPFLTDSPRQLITNDGQTLRFYSSTEQDDRVPPTGGGIPPDRC